MKKVLLLLTLCTATVLQAQPSAGEIGMNFDRWSGPTPMHYKLAFFAECGLFDRRASWTRWLKEDFSIGLKFTAAYDFRK